ncbi:MAG: cysteine dioxygenase family protein [Acidobacteria bacterium]|nr:cysteine dioxygenase family protein [Acidobacteriota bacterium]
MSTINAQPATSAEVPAQEPSSCLTLGGLVETLSALCGAPTLQEMNDWMRKAEPLHEDLRPYVGFKAGTYARHRVFLSEFVELLVLCWLPGQRTPIHDHNGSHGVVRVCEGVMWETMFQLEEERGLVYQSSREWTGGHITGADAPDIHQLGNPDVSGQNLITLHMYAPPLTSLNVYRVGRKESVSTVWMSSWNPTI